MSASISAGIRTLWQTLYQVSPIFMVGGSFANIPGGTFPLAGLVSSLIGTIQNAISGGLNSPSFGEFVVVPGGNLVSQGVATYPFANQQIAANATIQNPLNVSLLLKAPVNDTFGYLTKSAIFSSLQLSLQQHNNAGGTYTVMTPAFMYQGGLLTAMTDVSDGSSRQVQTTWQFDFFFPLITQQQASSAFNTAMSKISGGQPIAGAPSWQALGL